MLFPIVQRELLVAAKRPSTWWFRIAPATIGAFGVLWAMFFSFTALPALHGRYAFNILCGILILCSLLAGLMLTLDSITSERSNGTLELLQLSGLSGIEIVLGKIAAQAIPALLAISAVVPMLSIPVILGGVTGFEVVRAVGLILGTLALSLSISIFASSESFSVEEAMKKAVLILGGTLLIGSVVIVYFARGALFRKRERRWSVVKADRAANRLFLASLVGLAIFHFTVGSPAALIHMVLTRTQLGDHSGFYAGLIFMFFLSCVFLRLAGTFEALLPAEKRLTAAERPRSRQKRFTKSEDALMSLQKRGFKEFNAILICAGASLLSAVGGPLLVNAGFPGLYNVFSLVGFLPPLLLAFFMAQGAGRSLQELRETGMLELLWVAPVPWKKILLSQKRGFFQIMRLPILVVFIAYLPPLLWYNPLTAQYGIFYLFSIPFGIATIIAETFAIFWMSAYLVLQGRRALSAAGMVLAFVFVGPYLVLTPFVAMIAAGSRLTGLPHFSFFVYYCLHIAVYLAFIAWARPKVETWTPSSLPGSENTSEIKNSGTFVELSTALGVPRSSVL